MGPLFDKKARVMYRYTDSHFYEDETGDICEDLVQLKHVLDLSDNHKDHHGKTNPSQICTNSI